jgi:hypothetical protein
MRGSGDNRSVKARNITGSSIVTGNGNRVSTRMTQAAPSAAGTNQRTNSLDRIAAIFAGLAIIGLAVFLLIRNEPIADPRLFLVLRVVISFSAAVLGATIPGFLELGWQGRGSGDPGRRRTRSFCPDLCLYPGSGDGIRLPWFRIRQGGLHLGQNASLGSEIVWFIGTEQIRSGPRYYRQRGGDR